MMKRVLSYLIIFFNALLLVLVLFHDQLELPALIQAGGRTHPLLLHLPIALVLMVAVVWFSRNKLGEVVIRKIFPGLLGLSAVLTVLSAVAGVALSTEEGYEGVVLYRHMNLGTVLSIVTALQFFWSTSERMREKGFTLLTLVAVVAVTWTGHLGSVITHGEGFLT
ncbi:MAG: hypothetical protein ACKO3B_14380, partial [Bacteroidota bacterium]